MNKPVVFLRIAAVMTLVHAVLHTVGGVFGQVAPGPAAVAVEAMKVNQFLVVGHLRNFWEFYRGLGLAVSILLTAEAVVFWQLGSLVERLGGRVRPILATFAVGYAVMAVNSSAYFFIGPVIAEVLIVVCLGLAMVTVKSEAGAWEVGTLRA